MIPSLDSDYVLHIDSGLDPPTLTSSSGAMGKYSLISTALFLTEDIQQDEYRIAAAHQVCLSVYDSPFRTRVDKPLESHWLPELMATGGWKLAGRHTVSSTVLLGVLPVDIRVMVQAPKTTRRWCVLVPKVL